MAARIPGERGRRRQAERAAEKAARQREAAARQAPGGAPDRPIDIPTPSIVETRAEATPCPRCAARRRLIGHEAEVVGVVRLRVARVQCASCRTVGSLWFRIVAGV